jgi:hypothetical protein
VLAALVASAAIDAAPIVVSLAHLRVKGATPETSCHCSSDSLSRFRGVGLRGSASLTFDPRRPLHSVR